MRTSTIVVGVIVAGITLVLLGLLASLGLLQPMAEELGLFSCFVVALAALMRRQSPLQLLARVLLYLDAGITIFFRIVRYTTPLCVAHWREKTAQLYQESLGVQNNG